MRPTQWRDAQAWRDAGLQLSSASTEACKLYDAAISQYVGWYDDPSLGGLDGCLSKLSTEQPSFVMGHVVNNGLELLATANNARTDADLRMRVNRMCELATETQLSEREKLHVKAVEQLAGGHMDRAYTAWEDIMTSHPTDMLAVKMAHDVYFYLGLQPQMRDSIARVLPHWSPNDSMYGYLQGMYSFGLVETNMFAEAEKAARKGLELNPADAWSTHGLAHVLEMQGRHAEGSSFMSTTQPHWESAAMLAAHNFWHWAVFHVERGEYEQALDIFDSQIMNRTSKSGAMLDIVDASSLLCRLQMQGQAVGERWSDVYDVCASHLSDHVLAFNDAHVLMACLGAKQRRSTDVMMTTLQDYARDCEGTNAGVSRDVGLQLQRAIVAHSDGDYTQAVKLLAPLRYQLVRIGGSNAQRDVFNLLLIDAALKSPTPSDHRLARQLLYERKAMRNNSPMTDRLMAQAMAAHVD